MRGQQKARNKAIADIFLADPLPVVRLGVQALLESLPDNRVVGEAGSFAELVDQLDLSTPDLVIFDPALPDARGMNVLLTFRERYPRVPVLVYSAQSNGWSVMEAVRTGVQGYLTKDAPVQQLGEAVRTVLQGNSYLDPRIASVVMGRIGHAHERRRAGKRDFTERERAVLRLLVDGKRNKDISKSLCISEHTVKFHLAALFQKLRARNRTDVVRKAIEFGLISV